MSMTRRTWLASLASVAAVTVAGTPAAAQQTQKPNVVFILADNVGYGDLGAYGGGELRGAPTPARASDKQPPTSMGASEMACGFFQCGCRTTASQGFCLRSSSGSLATRPSVPTRAGHLLPNKTGLPRLRR